MNESLRYPGVDLPAPRNRSLLDRLFLDTAYSLTALPIGILTFVAMVTGLSVGVSLVVVWVGVPILVGTLIAARAFAHLERIRLRTLQDRAAPTPEYVVADDDAGTLRRLLTPLRDPQSWVDATWGIVSFVTGIIAFVVTVTWWALAAGGVTYWFWERWLPESDNDKTLAELIGLGDGRSADIWLNLAIGVIAVLLLPLVVRAVSMLHAGMAEAMLSGQRTYRPETEVPWEGATARDLTLPVG
jgi:hypothetical protein